MNRLTLKIKNKTKYKVPSKIKGDLFDELNVLILDINEYNNSSDIATEKAVIAFVNTAKSVASVIEKFLAKTIAVKCIANKGVKPREIPSVNLYLSTKISQEEVEKIIDAIFTTSLLIVNSEALYLDEKVYSCKKKKKQSEEKSNEDDSYIHILRQPLDAVVLPHTINNDIEDDKRALVTLGRNTKIILVNLDNLRFEDCVTFVEEAANEEKTEYGVYREDGTWCKRKSGEFLKDNEISVSPYITRKLCEKGHISLENLLILRVEGLEIKEIGVANIEKVLDSKVQISKQLLETIKEEFPDNADYCLIHEQTGSRMVINNSALEEKVLASKSKICLNYYQRVLMGLQPSSQVIQSLLHTTYYAKKQNDVSLDQTIQNIVNRCSDDEYLKQGELKKLLNNGGFQTLRIFPEFDTYGSLRSKENWVRRMWSKYAAKTVGAKSIQLRCARPYNVDEVSRIVRLASDKISILGIEPTDIVTLRYKENTTKARVLPFDINNDWKEIQLTNLVGDQDDKAEIESMVGIPAAIRDELGIPDINVAVSVERNAEYVFHKNSNVQFLPIVALIFSVFDLCNTLAGTLPILYQMLIASGFVLVLTPFVFYIMLSGERAKVRSSDKEEL